MLTVITTPPHSKVRKKNQKLFQKPPKEFCLHVTSRKLIRSPRCKDGHEMDSFPLPMIQIDKRNQGWERVQGSSLLRCLVQQSLGSSSISLKPSVHEQCLFYNEYTKIHIKTCLPSLLIGSSLRQCKGLNLKGCMEKTGIEVILLLGSQPKIVIVQRKEKLSHDTQALFREGSQFSPLVLIHFGQGDRRVTTL